MKRIPRLITRDPRVLREWLLRAGFREEQERFVDPAPDYDRGQGSRCSFRRAVQRLRAREASGSVRLPSQVRERVVPFCGAVVTPLPLDSGDVVGLELGINGKTALLPIDGARQLAKVLTEVAGELERLPRYIVKPIPGLVGRRRR